LDLRLDNEKIILVVETEEAFQKIKKANKFWYLDRVKKPLP
jgi:hypothetical protein